MELKIRELLDPQEKSDVCGRILHLLPGWFGVEASIAGYVKESADMPFFAACDKNEPIGFLALKQHNPHTAEIYVMGIHPSYHRLGAGRMLVRRCEVFCREHRCEYLTVKTLAAARADEGYSRTRQFYYAMGFRPLEVFPLYWDEANPCLFLAKHLCDAPKAANV